MAKSIIWIILVFILFGFVSAYPFIDGTSTYIANFTAFGNKTANFSIAKLINMKTASVNLTRTTTDATLRNDSFSYNGDLASYSNNWNNTNRTCASSSYTRTVSSFVQLDLASNGGCGVGGSETYNLSSYDSFNLSVSMSLLNIPVDPPNPPADVATYASTDLYFRSDLPLNESYAAPKNGYSLSIIKPNDFNLYYLRLNKVVDGTASVLNSTLITNWVDSRLYNFTIVALNNEIIVYNTTSFRAFGNETPLFQTTDGTYSSGRIALHSQLSNGFGAAVASQSIFDNFNISSGSNSSLNVRIYSGSGETNDSFISILNATNSPFKATLNTTQLNRLLRSCVAISGNCSIPLLVHSDSLGLITLTALNLTYYIDPQISATTNKTNYLVTNGVFLIANVTDSFNNTPYSTLKVNWTIYYQNGSVAQTLNDTFVNSTGFANTTFTKTQTSETYTVLAYAYDYLYGNVNVVNSTFSFAVQSAVLSSSLSSFVVSGYSNANMARDFNISNTGTISMTNLGCFVTGGFPTYISLSPASINASSTTLAAGDNLTITATGNFPVSGIFDSAITCNSSQSNSIAISAEFVVSTPPSNNPSSGGGGGGGAICSSSGSSCFYSSDCCGGLRCSNYKCTEIYPDVAFQQFPEEISPQLFQSVLPGSEIKLSDITVVNLNKSIQVKASFECSDQTNCIKTWCKIDSGLESATLLAGGTKKFQTSCKIPSDAKTGIAYTGSFVVQDIDGRVQKGTRISIPVGSASTATANQLVYFGTSAFTTGIKSNLLCLSVTEQNCIFSALQVRPPIGAIPLYYLLAGILVFLIMSLDGNGKIVAAFILFWISVFYFV